MRGEPVQLTKLFVFFRLDSPSVLCRYLISGPRRHQLEPEDEGAHGEDVWSGSLCQDVEGLGGRHFTVCQTIKRYRGQAVPRSAGT